jgi:hypothetical protein
MSTRRHRTMSELLHPRFGLGLSSHVTCLSQAKSLAPFNVTSRTVVLDGRRLYLVPSPLSRIKSSRSASLHVSAAPLQMLRGFRETGKMVRHDIHIDLRSKCHIFDTGVQTVQPPLPSLRARLFTFWICVC